MDTLIDLPIFNGEPTLSEEAFQKKYREMHFRLSDPDRKLIERACILTHATYSGKLRELVVGWAREQIGSNA